jgi:hypothetical protein
MSDDPTITGTSGPHSPNDTAPTGADAPQPRLVRRQAVDAVDPVEGGPDQPTGTGRVDAAAATHGTGAPDAASAQPGMTDLGPEADEGLRVDGPDPLTGPRPD